MKKEFINLIFTLFTNPAFIFVFFIFILICFVDFLEKNLFTPGSKFRNKRKQIKNNLKIKNKHKAGGILFGLKSKHSGNVVYSPINDEGHVLCVGGSGMGKTSALLIPTLNSWANSGGTSLSIDISGDISKNINVSNKLVYAPADFDSTPFNIFGHIDRLSTKSEQDKALDMLSLLIMPPVLNASDGEKYYTDNGRKILASSLIAFYHQGKDFIDICCLINELNWRDLLNLIDETEDIQARIYINDFVGAEDRYTGNAKQCCNDAISIFVKDDALKHNIRRPKSNEIAYEPSKVEAFNCFILIKDEELEYYSKLSSILLSQSLEYFQKRSLNANHQILCCLDEAASLGTINILPALRKFRKRKVRLFVLTQALADLDLTWGNSEKKAMMINFKYKVILECSEPEEQIYWTKLIGEELKVRIGTSTSENNHTNSISETKDYIINPSSLANLGKELILLYPGGYRILYKNFYYKR